MLVPSLVAIVIWIGSSTPRLRPISSTRPTIRSTAATGSLSSPNVSARKNIVSESVVPSIDGKSESSTASRSSRLTLGELPDQAVVHPAPVAVTERVRVRLLDRRPGRGPDVGEEER